MSTTVILPAPDLDTQIRARLAHAIESCGLTARTFAEQLGVPKSTIHRHINPKGVSASYRRGLTTDSIDGYLEALNAAPDGILKPAISHGMGVYLRRVKRVRPKTALPLQNLEAIEAHAMGLVEVRGTESRSTTYRLHLTAAGRRALRK